MTEPFSLYDLLRPVRTDIDTATATGGNAQNQAVSNASGVAQHQTTLTGKTNSGNFVTDSFNRTGATIGTGWTATNTGVGSVATNGADAYWAPSGTSVATEFDRYTATTTQTDYQLLTVVLDTPLVASGALQRIIARCDSGQTNYVYLQWDGANISVWKVVAGTATQVGSNVAYIPQVSDQIQFTVGTGTSVREFIGSINNNPLIDVTDTAATLSVVGSSNRYTGLYWSVGAGPTLPGNLHSFNVADNSTPTTVGSGAFIYRTSTTNVSASTGSNLMPTSFFGNTKYSTSDITVDLTNNKFTVTRPGLYLCVLRAQIPSPLLNNTIIPLLYKSGSIDTWGPSWWAASSTDGTGPNAMWSMFPVQLAASDYVQPGYNYSSSGANVFTGEATGAKTYFSIVAASRSGF